MDHLSDLPPANLCVRTDGSVATNFGPGRARVFSMQHPRGLNITFLSRQSNFIQLQRRDHSPPSCPRIMPPTLLYLPIHVPGCLYQLPVLPRTPELCLKLPCPECCVENLVLYRFPSDLAQLSFH